MANKYQQVATLLRSTAKEINTILSTPDDEMHRIHLANNLEREATYITMITGSGDTHEPETKVLGPATTIGGKPIKKLRKFTEADLTPSDDKLFQLKQDVESAIEYFRADRTPESLIAQIPDLVIRGVAKKVGMKVTKDDPAVLLPEFVAEIQEKVREQFPKEQAPLDGDEEPEDDGETFSEDQEINDVETETFVGKEQTIGEGEQGAQSLQAAHEAQMAQVQLPEHIKEQLAEEERLEKQQFITDLQRKVDEASQRNETLRIELASEPNKNKRTAIRKQITSAEAEIASLTKQLEDANKD